MRSKRSKAWLQRKKARLVFSAMSGQDRVCPACRVGPAVLHRCSHFWRHEDGSTYLCRCNEGPCAGFWFDGPSTVP